MLAANSKRNKSNAKRQQINRENEVREMTTLTGVQVKTVDYKGRTFSEFYPAKDSIIPGWIVMGKGEDYGGRLRMVCARPDVKARTYKYINGRVARGWHTRREAQKVADVMNAELAQEALAGMEVGR
jgi:hypothetical protein